MNAKRWIFFGIPWLVGALVAIFSPNNALSFDLAKAVWKTASFIFPTVEKMKGDYELGQVAKFYYSSVWMLSPLFFLGAYFDLQQQRDILIANCRQKKTFFILFFCIFSLVCAFVLINFTFESKDVNDVRVYMSFHSRWGMALAGGLMPAFASTSVAMAVFGFKNARYIFD